VLDEAILNVAARGRRMHLYPFVAPPMSCERHFPHPVKRRSPGGG
jgi:hypothetical protein